MLISRMEVSNLFLATIPLLCDATNDQLQLYYNRSVYCHDHLGGTINWVVICTFNFEHMHG